MVMYRLYHCNEKTQLIFFLLFNLFINFQHRCCTLQLQLAFQTWQTLFQISLFEVVMCLIIQRLSFILYNSYMILHLSVLFISSLELFSMSFFKFLYFYILFVNSFAQISNYFLSNSFLIQIMQDQNNKSCRHIEQFERGDIIGEGTYGIVYFSRDRSTNEQLAIKKMKVLDTQNGFPITSLREVKLLKALTGHPNIIQLKEVVVGIQPQNVYLVFEYCDIDLYKLFVQMSIDNVTLNEGEIKCLALQLIKGVSYAHSKHIIHRDLKLSNILLNRSGILKIADFGLAREFQVPYKPITRKVVTLWYRAPQLLLRNKNYGQSVDVWSLGCIIAELIRQGKPLFRGKNPIHQFQMICQIIGYPSAQDWPFFYSPQNDELRKEMEKYNWYNKNKIISVFNHSSENCVDLLNKMFKWDPEKRINLNQVFSHPYFTQLPKATFPDQIKVLNKLEFYSRKANQELIKKKK